MGGTGRGRGGRGGSNAGRRADFAEFRGKPGPLPTTLVLGNCGRCWALGVAVASERVRGLHTLGGGIFSLCLVLVPWMKKVPSC